MKVLSRSASTFLLFTLLIACQTTPLPMPSENNPRLIQSNSSSHSADSVHVEWGHFLEQDYQRVFQAHDLNQNGLIEASEVAYAPRGFAFLDSNHDGVLSPTETRPDNRYMSYLVDLMVKNLKPETDYPASESPDLDPLPNPAELQRFEQEIAQQPINLQRLHKTPVLLVPGYAEPSWYFMYGIYRNLKANGWAVEGIDLFPNFAPAEEQAQKIQAKIEEMRQRYGVEQVDLVVHSFGGLISRYYIQNMQGVKTVRNLVTIATPHHGTYAAYLGPGEAAVQLRPDSDFLTALNANGFAYAPVRYTSIWSNLDEIVLPPKNSIMPDSEVHYVPWTGHLTIMFSKRTYTHIRDALQKP